MFFGGKVDLCHVDDWSRPPTFDFAGAPPSAVELPPTLVQEVGDDRIAISGSYFVAAGAGLVSARLKRPESGSRCQFSGAAASASAVRSPAINPYG